MKQSSWQCRLHPLGITNIFFHSLAGSEITGQTIVIKGLACQCLLKAWNLWTWLNAFLCRRKAFSNLVCVCVFDGVIFQFHTRKSTMWSGRVCASLIIGLELLELSTVAEKRCAELWMLPCWNPRDDYQTAALVFMTLVLPFILNFYHLKK